MANGNEKLETFDENGNKVVFEVLDIISVDDVEYAVLLPENSDEETELLVMRLKQDGDEYELEEIEDDDEFNKVAAYIEELEDEIDE
ncbi:DUF1292 domain-containing protein [bacterium]|nr:DUF1292 domain-containing protein [bacterium]